MSSCYNENEEFMSNDAFEEVVITNAEETGRSYGTHKQLFTFFAVISNVCHRFSHMRDCENSQTVIFLQKIGILSSHTYHSVHHETSLTRYCPISVYNNYILDSIYFWRILECIVFLLTGITPSRNQYNKYKSIHNHMHENAKLECPKKPTKEDIDELKLLLEKYRKCNTNS